MTPSFALSVSCLARDKYRICVRHFRYREKQDLKIKNGPTNSPIEEGEEEDAADEVARLREELRREEEEQVRLDVG